jgi:hypothetical protein
VTVKVLALAVIRAEKMGRGKIGFNPEGIHTTGTVSGYSERYAPKTQPSTGCTT